MKKFWGDINGKLYTDKDEFDKALAALDNTDDICVSYKYVTVMDVAGEITAEDDKSAIECIKNYVSENEYIKHITHKADVELNDNLINRLKSADNKSDIKDVVCNKIMGFDAKIEDNLLHINELKSDYKKLNEKIKLINNQIKTLDDANNNYYLHKEYYTNIKNLVELPDDERKNEGCVYIKENECDNETITFEDIYNMTPYALAEYLKKKKINTLSDLVEYFINNF
jgi:hypothetical protein